MPGPRGSFRGKSGKSAKSRPDPTQVPEFFGPVLIGWLDLAPTRRSGTKKAARGCPRIQIWSHEGLNQPQKLVFGRSRYQPIGHPGRRCLEGHVWKAMSGRPSGRPYLKAPPMIFYRQRTIGIYKPGASETGDFIFLPEKIRTLEKWHPS